jgi:DNA-3-methyladenine glycosylase II
MWFDNTTSADRWYDAIRHLRRDPILRRIMKRVGPCTLSPRKDVFVALVQSILSQQVSVAAADSMYRKLKAKMPRKSVTPKNVLAFLTTSDDETVRSCGLSRQKRGYVQDVSQKFADGTIKPRSFHAMTDEAMIEHLTQVKGIGRWTVEMLLIFVFNRPDVWPVDDLGIQERYRQNFGLEHRPKPKELAPLGDKWKPWRTVASWYLWKSGNATRRREGSKGDTKGKKAMKATQRKA